MERVESITVIPDGILDIPDDWSPEIRVTPNGTVLVRLTDELWLRWRSLTFLEGAGDDLLEEVVERKKHVLGQCSTDAMYDEAVGA